jgi:hypothetical protein
VRPAALGLYGLPPERFVGWEVASHTKSWLFVDVTVQISKRHLRWRPFYSDSSFMRCCPPIGIEGAILLEVDRVENKKTKRCVRHGFKH